MNSTDLLRFQSHAEGSGVLLYYSGAFTPAIVAATADTLKQRLQTEDVTGPARRKLFSTFVEMAQNVLHYATPTPSGAIGVGRSEAGAGGEPGHYWIACINPIDPAHVERLTDKLEAVRAMSLDEIKQHYREQLHNTEHAQNDSISRGAGLGLLTIARDASAPLEYSFTPALAGGDSATLFHMKACV